MLCCLSGQVPVKPVVSLKSGHIFEKHLLLKYLQQNQNKCPMTQQELSIDHDIIDIKLPTNTTTTNESTTINTTPSNTNFTSESASIPQLLSLFQNEWDTCMLETFTLKQHLQQTRQELAHALYQYDAACRVIAKLNDENQKLQDKLQAQTNGQVEKKDDIEMTESIPVGTIPENILATIDAKQKTLAKERKSFKSQIAPGLAEKLQGITTWQVMASMTPHSADASISGVTCISINPMSNDIIATGGMDGYIKLLDRTKQQIRATLSGHTKKISSVEFHPIASDLLLSTSFDKTVKVWSIADHEKCEVMHSITTHEGPVCQASCHPTGDLFLTGSHDGTWGLHCFRTGTTFARKPISEDSNNQVTAAEFHPDGVIFATGSDQGVVQMWDVRSDLSNVLTFEASPSHSTVSSLAFSPNGYILVSGSMEGTVKWWDLRKLKASFEMDLTPPANLSSSVRKNSKKNSLLGLTNLVFDPSGMYIGAANGTTVQILREVKKSNWESIHTIEHEFKAQVAGIKFSPDSSYLATCALDRTVKLFGRQ